MVTGIDPFGPGVEMDVLGIAYGQFPDAERQAVVAAYPRTAHFKEDIIQTFYDGMKHRPETTYGTVNADVRWHDVENTRIRRRMTGPDLSSQRLRVRLY